MAKLPSRQKVTLLLYRRAGPDEILLVPREIRGALRWSLPTAEAEGAAREIALAMAAKLTSAPPLADLDLRMSQEYRVKEGPSAGEWTERYHAVEVAPIARAREGRWAVHYEAKVEAGADAPRVREAITKLREAARLKP